MVDPAVLARVRPATVTVFPVPTFLSEKVPVAPVATRVMVSPETTPTGAALAVFRVAFVVAS